MRFLCVVLALFLWPGNPGPDAPASSGKIGGVSLVPPTTVPSHTWPKAVREIGAGWVAVMPYAFSESGSPAVTYGNHARWGLRTAGVRSLIRQARMSGLDVMVKPMVQVKNSWPGEFDPGNEAAWQQWEDAYAQYILEMARISEEEGVGIFAIGTEFVKAVQKRLPFWIDLIRRVRKVFSGKLTYAANWDNFHRIPLWKELDFIGIDAYFPISYKDDPDLKELMAGWKLPYRTLRGFAKKFEKPVLFTEFGYRSTPHCTWKQWELERIPPTQSVDLQAQVLGYQAVFESFWQEDWFAGGFLWQWFTQNDAGGLKNSDYTPQGKPVATLIRRYYSQDSLAQKQRVD